MSGVGIVEFIRLLLKAIVSICLIPLGFLFGVYARLFTSRNVEIKVTASHLPALTEEAVAAIKASTKNAATKASVKSQFFQLPNSKIKLHAIVAGPQDGPLLLCLHGFPEGWHTWAKLIAPLADVGFLVVAPDQRGYGQSDKPEAVRSYQLSTLADDMADLITVLKKDSAFVLGHDWGGIVGFGLTMKYPDYVNKFLVLNAAHPTAWKRGILTSPFQFLKSWYFFYFGLPWLPDFNLNTSPRAVFKSAFKVCQEAYTDEDIRYLEASALQPGAMTSALNYYRALQRYGTGIKVIPIDTPTRIVWGKSDSALDLHLLDILNDGEYIPGLHDVILVPNTSHWIPMERPAAVFKYTVEFFKDNLDGM